MIWNIYLYLRLFQQGDTVEGSLELDLGLFLFKKGGILVLKLLLSLFLGKRSSLQVDFIPGLDGIDDEENLVLLMVDVKNTTGDSILQCMSVLIDGHMGDADVGNQIRMMGKDGHLT